MVTALILLPVLLILVWLYWYLLPQRKWMLADSVVLALLLAFVMFFISTIEHSDFTGAGPLWPYIVSAGGAYGILTVGLGIALAWRRHRARP